MFDSFQQAVDFNKQNDGGIPLFKYEAVMIPNSEPPKYEDVAWVTIMNRGDAKTIIERAKRPEDEKRWPEQWKAFLAGEEAPLNGIPLKEFPAMTPASIATCHSVHVRTVEELADYPDGQIKNLGQRGYALKKAATEFIEYRKTDVSGLLARIAELEKHLGDSITDNPERCTGSKPSKAKRGNGRKSKPRRKGVSDTKDSGSKTSEA